MTQRSERLDNKRANLLETESSQDYKLIRTGNPTRHAAYGQRELASSGRTFLSVHVLAHVVILVETLKTPWPPVTVDGKKLFLVVLDKLSGMLLDIGGEMSKR